MSEDVTVANRRIIAIAGPTAVGKTALSLALAERLSGEIVSCDSMQIYRGMDIGTAKPTEEELARIPHHLINIVSPDSLYSAADYERDARLAIADIQKRGKTPIFCGGTGLYLESVLYEGKLQSPEGDEALRASLWARSADDVYEELMRVDPDSARATHKNNRKRVIRALEIYLISGKTKTEWDRENTRSSMIEGAELYVLTSSDREALYQRIDTRVDLMMKAGLLDEVRSLSLDPSSTAGQAIGYKEFYPYFSGEATLDEAVAALKQASRHYAKRQLTWWERNRDAIKIDMSTVTVEEALEAIVAGDYLVK